MILTTLDEIIWSFRMKIFGGVRGFIVSVLDVFLYGWNRSDPIGKEMYLIFFGIYSRGSRIALFS